VEGTLSADTKGPKILARTFFEQLQRAGYNSNQIIAVATELIDLVTENLKVNGGRASLQAGGGNGQAVQSPPQ
jgi:hypothetical protein